MGSPVSSPAVELIANGGFDDASVWTLFDFTTIAGGVMDIDGIMTSKGGGFQTINTKIHQVYQFKFDITFKGGDPTEFIRLHFGTGGSRVSSLAYGEVQAVTFLLTDPDGTGLISLETAPNFDNNHMHIDNVSCKLYADIIAEDLGLTVLPDTFTDTWLIPGNRVMLRVVNLRASINNLFIIDL